jgi:hypothetical protein
MKNNRKAAAWFVAAWFILVYCISGLQLYRNGSNRIGIAVAVSALAPIVIFAVWYTLSDGFRKFVLSQNPRTLTRIQSWRLAGISFVILQAYGMLPAVFALPAGYGDMAVGATALFVASRFTDPNHRNSFLLWQVLGIADLIMAVGLGVTAGLLGGEGASMAPMTVLPLSLIPTFIVPLLFIFHLICIAQARRWKSFPMTYGLQSRPVVW